MEYKELALFVLASDRKIFDYNIHAIHSFIANHENVPAKLVNDLLSQILPKKEYKLEQYDLMAKEKSKYAVEFITEYPRYQLNWEFKGFKNDTYDFSRFAQRMLNSFFQYETRKAKNCSKAMVIQFFYNAFLEDIESDVSKRPKERVSDYTLRVMVGLFAIAAGYNGKNDKILSPKEIYQFCRNS